MIDLHEHPVDSRLLRSLPKIRVTLTFACMLITALAGCRGSDESPSGELPPSVDGSTDSLQATQIVPTLDTPIEAGKNVIWCATFQAAWKGLQNDIVGEAVKLDGASEICDRLNAANDPAEFMPPKSFYAASGWSDDGIVERIERGFSARFPDKPAPVFPGLAPGGFVAYAYLETSVPFTVPYFDADAPMQFVSSDGGKTPIRAFGIRDEDGDAYGELRKQAKILFESYSGDEHNPVVDEFILDLCIDSRPVQLVAARIERKRTLGEMIAYVEEKIQSREDPWYIGGNDVILVPNMCWRLAHHFAALEKKPFLNEGVLAKQIDVALQDVHFRLDRSGAELASQAHVGWASAGKDLYVFDRPFLVVLRLRESKKPFFAVWVDNTELLYPWD